MRRLLKRRGLRRYIFYMWLAGPMVAVLDLAGIYWPLTLACMFVWGVLTGALMAWAEFE